MKKLMIGLVGALAMVAGAEIESSNTVGFSGSTTRNRLNWYSPQFFSIGNNTTDIQSIRLDDQGAGLIAMGQESMQIVGPLGSAVAIYTYLPAGMDMEGLTTESFWSDEEFGVVSVSFDAGEGVAIDNGGNNNFKIVNSGDIPTSDALFAAHNRLNWLGNPFPQSIDISAIQLDDGGTGIVANGQESMQIVGPLGSATEIYTYLPAGMDMEGLTTEPFWSDEEFNPVSLTLNPGDGFAIDNGGNNNFTIKIVCPYKK